MEISTSMLIVIVLVALVGVLGVAGIGILYWKTYPRIDPRDVDHYWRHYYEIPLRFPNDRGLILELFGRTGDIFTSLIPDTLSKRQEFWTTLVKLSLSILVVILIVILMLLKIVSAEAGLPILAAVGGAAISQGANAVNSGVPRPRPEPPAAERSE